MTAARVPAPAAAWSWASACSAPTASRARSAGSCSSARAGTHRSPSTSSYRGLTGCTGPRNPPSSTRRTSPFPNVPGRVLAPTIATERGASNFWSPGPATSSTDSGNRSAPLSPMCQPALTGRRMFSARRRPPPDRREPGHLLQITQVHVVTDVAPGRVIGRGEIPRGLHAGAERPGDGQPPLLAQADLVVQLCQVPAGGDLLPEAAGQRGRRRIVRQVDPLVRVGFQVEELVGVGWRVDE